MGPIVLMERVQPTDLNSQGGLFGGKVSAWMDLAAGNFIFANISTQRMLTKVLTVDFIAPGELNDLISFYVVGHKIGNTSVTVELLAQVQRRDGDAVKTIDIATGRVVLVAIGAQGKSTPIVARNSQPGTQP